MTLDRQRKHNVRFTEQSEGPVVQGLSSNCSTPNSQTEIGAEVLGLEGVGVVSYCLLGAEFLFGKTKSFWKPW